MTTTRCELFVEGPLTNGRDRNVMHRQAAENETADEVPSTTILYVSIEGLDDFNSFELATDAGDSLTTPTLPTTGMLLKYILHVNVHTAFVPMIILLHVFLFLYQYIPQVAQIFSYTVHTDIIVCSFLINCNSKSNGTWPVQIINYMLCHTHELHMQLNTARCIALNCICSLEKEVH